MKGKRVPEATKKKATVQYNLQKALAVKDISFLKLDSLIDLGETRYREFKNKLADFLPDDINMANSIIKVFQ